MSADNGIYVLATIKNTKIVDNGVTKCSNYKVYRIAYAQAIDNFDWYKENESHNLGNYIKEIWGDSEVFEDKGKALLAAHELAEKSDYLEYGVSVIDTDLRFYRDM